MGVKFMREILRVGCILSVMSGPVLMVALAMPSHAEPGLYRAMVDERASHPVGPGHSEGREYR